MSKHDASDAKSKSIDAVSYYSVLISCLLYGASLVFPAFYGTGWHGDESLMLGFFALLLGGLMTALQILNPLSLLENPLWNLIVCWLANPLIFCSWFLTVRGGNSYKLRLICFLISLSAFGLALSARLIDFPINAYDRLDRLGQGHYVWSASMFAMMIGNAVLVLQKRPRNSSKTKF